jgi:hypothetical protein
VERGVEAPTVKLVCACVGRWICDGGRGIGTPCKCESCGTCVLVEVTELG